MSWFREQAPPETPAAMAQTIRRAVWEDAPAIVALGERFLAASTYAAQIAYNSAHMRRLVDGLLGNPEAVIFVSETAGQIVGVIGVALFDHAMSGERSATEATWFVDPEHRGHGMRLLRAAEDWAQSRGAMMLQVTAPTSDLCALYPRLGYAHVETAFQKRFVPLPVVIDDVLMDPDAYRASVLAVPVATYHAGPGTDFYNMALCPFPELPAWFAKHHPELMITMSAIRKAPAGQIEPHFIHTDRDMGTWSGIFYLMPHPPDGDGTTFYQHRVSHEIQSGLAFDVDDAVSWRDRDQWEAWHHVPARFNRLVLFPSTYYHARALEQNYGEGDDARLIHILFGTGPLFGKAGVS
jgi:GNAT superfamily N-acetyltransferase